MLVFDDLFAFIRESSKEGSSAEWSGEWRMAHSLLLALRNQDKEAILEALAPIRDSENPEIRFYVNSCMLVAVSFGLHFPNVDSIVRDITTSEYYSSELLRAWAEEKIARYLMHDDKRAQAVSLLLRSASVFEHHGWISNLVVCQCLIADIQYKRGDLAASTTTYAQAIDNAVKAGIVAGLPSIRANMATVLYQSGNFAEARSVYEEVLDSDYGIKLRWPRARIHALIAAMAKLTGDYPEALRQYERAIAYLEGSDHRDVLIPILNGYSDLHMRMGNIQAAREIFAQVQAEENVPLTAQTKIEVATVHADILASDGRLDEAYQVVTEALALGRAFSLADSNRQLAEDALRYLTDARHRMPILEELVSVQRERIKAVPDSISSILSMRSEYEQQRAHREVERQQELARTIMTTQDNILRDIGRDLHDSIGQDLTVLVRMIERLRRDFNGAPDQLEQLLTDMQTAAGRAATDARRISHLLAGSGITAEGLPAAMEQIAQMMRSADSSLNVDVIVDWPKPPLPDGVARALYRGFQTLVQNVLRHARATHCTLQLLIRDGHAVAIVEDDGRGFDGSAVASGLGMREVKARMELLGGSVLVDSSPGHGAYIELRVPFNPSEAPQ